MTTQFEDFKAHPLPDSSDKGASLDLPTSPAPYNWLDNIHIVSGVSRKTADIAGELGIKMGAVINPVICSIGDNSHAVVLMAGDMACDPIHISRTLGRPGLSVSRLKEDQIVKLTGMSHEDLFPLQLALDMPVIIDASLKRFDMLYSRAGSPKCLIETTYQDLKELTQGIVSYAVSSASWPYRK